MSDIVIGLVSDTHGMLRPQVAEALRGVSQILHAGDIGAASILDELAIIAPVTAVRGNVDVEPWAQSLPLTAHVRVADVLIELVHQGRSGPSVPGVGVVVCGHSHQPDVFRRQGVLYVNPGSAGPRRFHLPIALARLRINGSRATAEIVELVR